MQPPITICDGARPRFPLTLLYTQEVQNRAPKQTGLGGAGFDGIEIHKSAAQRHMETRSARKNTLVEDTKQAPRKRPHIPFWSKLRQNQQDALARTTSWNANARSVKPARVVTLVSPCWKNVNEVMVNTNMALQHKSVGQQGQRLQEMKAPVMSDYHPEIICVH